MTIWTPILDRSKPLYLAIADAISKDVESGTLPEGARLPPQRDLAWRIGVTLGTVTRAYKEAEQRGLLSGEVGRGSYVRPLNRVSVMPLAAPDLDGLHDLSHAMPPAVVAPEDFDDALAYIMREPKRLELLAYAPPEGLAQHRQLGAAWLKMSGIHVDPSQVMVTAGAHVALTVVLSAIAEPREAVMAEKITYALLAPALRNAYLEGLPIEMDAEGLLPDAFERAAKSGQSRILYLVPSLQNPTTHTLSHARREAIVAIARKHGITIIEDDIFRLLDGRTQPSTLYAMAPERTFHITGLSKTQSPGLRIGFIALPRGQQDALKSYVRSGAVRAVGLTGEMARYWWESGRSLEILTRIRNELAGRRAIFQDMFKDFTFSCSSGAPFAWLELPAPWTAGQFAATCAARGVRVTPASAFQVQQGGGQGVANRHVRVCFGSPATAPQFRAGLGQLLHMMSRQDADDFTPVA